MMKEFDEVNNPERYTAHCSMECISVMKLTFGKEAIANFCMLNAFKYMWRYKKKNGLEDLRKANWYLDYIEDYLDERFYDVELFNRLCDLLKDLFYLEGENKS